MLYRHTTALLRVVFFSAVTMSCAHLFICVISLTNLPLPILPLLQSLRHATRLLLPLGHLASPISRKSRPCAQKVSVRFSSLARMRTVKRTLARKESSQPSTPSRRQEGCPTSSTYASSPKTRPTRHLSSSWATAPMILPSVSPSPPPLMSSKASCAWSLSIGFVKTHPSARQPARPSPALPTPFSPLSWITQLINTTLFASLQGLPRRLRPMSNQGQG